MFSLPFAAFLAATISQLPPEPFARTAVGRSLPMLWKGAKGYVEAKSCFGCHNQAHPMIAFHRADLAGFPLAAKDRDLLLDHLQAFLDRNLENFESGNGTGGHIDTAGWALLTLHHGGRKPNATTDAMVKYIIGDKAESGHWRFSSNRPPSQSSPFTSTYLAVRSLKLFTPEKEKEAADKRIAAARTWLEKTPAKETEDVVFRLQALHAAGSNAKVIAKASEVLLALQRADGGWGQRPQDGTDAYATATALIALVEAGGLKTDSRTYRDGAMFLLNKQETDGTWHVATRATPIQKYFESGFPHGKDQFISISASSWATAALALAIPKK